MIDLSDTKKDTNTVPSVNPDALLADIDKESAYRRLSGSWHLIITVLLIAFSLFQLGTSILGTLPAQLQRMVHLGFVMLLGFWLYPATSKGDRNKMHPLDFVLGLAFVGIAGYYIINYKDLVARSGAYTTLDLIIGAIGIVLVLEACRRIVGIPIVVIASLFILYAYFGPYMPGFMNHRGYGISRIISHLFYTTEGIMGMPLGLCATFIFLFILFGSFLEKTGIGQFFIDLSNGIAGFSAGGPAKVAVLTSALQGTVSGSSVSNTVTTGSFTIPLMKSLGYSPEFAGAVEAAASTGGQIMPPIMGAAAFLIAEAVGVNYFDVAKAAIIPAILYFSGIWIMVHLEAKKLGLKGVPREKLPKIWPLLRDKGHLLLPLVAIVALLIMGKTPTFSALGGIAASIVVPYLRKSTWVPFKEVASALVSGAKNTIGVACACGVAGIIVGVVTLTGLGLKLGEGLFSLTGGLILPTLFFTMITSLVLGMGVPTTANYLITSVIAAPIIMKLGVPALAAHMFAFYFGILADITPPVALAAYAGSAISGGNAFKTGCNATKLAIGAFIIPYIFVLSPELILIDTVWYEVIQIICTSLIGMLGVSACMTGYLMGKTAWWERILLLAGGLMLIIPGLITDLCGIGLVGGVAAFQYITYRKLKTVQV
ncbi:TRAP transporter 4TM/12TM fusion protein [Hydrogenoanaerobacterium saccharovorans]|uniref:TRAP transporter, 4TM/12TM fusion protein n=1 Tax=Hydrogenoanaerobacterium saccharovorans TaxID=474960 RepID=A0A1H8CLH6_9FIRM|nr:TRAP transporter 4TM/12TM fusion protein [Hydrogenoanaerobacterium saccharovorans]SEM96131.1 TRAP transporter, 4TM/12TM fusion protein [Hydrogenoanaerobacterium saccharovorans]